MLLGHLLHDLFMLFLRLGQFLYFLIGGLGLLFVLFLQGFQLLGEFLILLVGILNLFLELTFDFFDQGGS